MTTLPSHNPFVGPRPIQTGEALHGRAPEVRELFDRLQARRIVVLHSPSGAGKSSLVAAGLIPRLREAKFDVWRTIRVHLDPSGLEGVPPETNRYLLSALLSLEEELPQDRRRPPAELSGMDLLAYLESRPRRKNAADRSPVLIFDQFEEVLTVGPGALAEKREFFTSVGRALDTGNYWALFIVREDYLGALAPYRDRVPTQLANTFRLDLLGLDAAREAAVALARAGGRTFPAADQLVRDLATVKIQRLDGRFAEEQGAHVEPVLLQVACHRIWEAVPLDRRSIDAMDVQRNGLVSSSLRGYYANAMSRIAGGDPTVERAIRRWMGEYLIVDGARSQVRDDPDQSGGLDNRLIGGLLQTYLVRAETLAGVTWFELSHDRLITPVQQDNAAWEEAHLHPMQVQARLWENGRRDDALLLSSEALWAAVPWAEEHADLLLDREREFLAQSQRHRGAEARRRRSVAGLTALVIVLLLAGAVWTRWVAARDAEADRVLADALQTEGELAEAQALAAEALAALAAARADAAELREAQANEERARAEQSLKDFLRRNPSMRPEAIALRQQARRDRWEVLKGSEDNAWAEASLHSIRREAATIARESDTLAKAHDALRAELVSLDAIHGASRRPGVAAFSTLRAGFWDGLAAARRTNGELRAQLLGAGLLAPPLRSPTLSRNWSRFEPTWSATVNARDSTIRHGYDYPGDEAFMASRPDRDEQGLAYAPAAPEVIDALMEQVIEVQSLEMRIGFVEENARSVGLAGAALRDDADRQAAKLEAESARRDAVTRDTIQALDAVRAAQARRTELRTAMDTLGPRLFDLRWSDALVEADRMAYSEEQRRLDKESYDLESQDDHLRDVLKRRKLRSDAGAAP